MDTVVAILNYNGKAYLEKFLPSVISCSQNHADIAVIDNASTDDSLAFLKANYPSVQVILLPKNLGFAGGYNEGLKQVNHPYLLLLNSDIEVSPNYLQPLKNILQTNPSIGCVQPKIKSYAQKNYFEHAGAAGGFVDFLGYPFCRGRLLHSIEEDTGQYDEDMPVFWTTGACMMIKKEVFDAAGGFDASFFAHMEEIDLCWRIQNLGYTCYYTSKSTIYHVGGGTLSYHSPRKVFLNFRNNLLMLLKNLPISSLLWIIPTRLVLDGLAGILFLFQGNPKASLAVLKAHISFYQLFYQNIQKRIKIIHQVTLFPKSLIFQFYFRKNRSFSALLYLCKHVSR